SASASLAPIQISRPTSEFPEWPARQSDIDKARQFLQRAARAAGDEGSEKILLIPDKDADGLSAGCIVKRTLIRLGANPENIVLHHIPAGKAPSADEELQSYNARWIIVLDQGSVRGPALVPGGELGWESDDEKAVRTMVLDHHHVKDLDHDCPTGALLLNASHHSPVCTSALLAWCVCRPFWPDDMGGAGEIDYLALIGTCGDLSINVSWDAPWPDFEPELKRWGKSKIGKVVAMINAPRRTPLHDAFVSWKALDVSESPLDVLDAEKNPSFERLNEARRLVASETEKQTHTPPKFSKDSRVALLTISTPYQVHPSIATRWSGTLKGAKRLEIVMCANTGFDGQKERYVHFSCRIANAAKARGENPNIIELLNDYAARDPSFLDDLRESGQGSFARGHREASGGILSPPFWRRFVDIMQIGVKPTPPPDSIGKSPKKQQLPPQNNKL
ncbi:DHH phosphoesterase, partial [Meira miltonrushii]